MSTKTSTDKKHVRVYIDGCFDLIHYGHANAIREAKKLGDTLVVGVHNDADIMRHKGPPVYNQEERYQIIRSIKWVDEVVEDAPYLMTEENLDELKCDFLAHGDDKSISRETGLNTYQVLIDAGKYVEFKRTRGISSTDLVGRMLLLTPSHHDRSVKTVDKLDCEGEFGIQRSGTGHFAASTRKIMQFSSGNEPKPGDRIVYTTGSFDLLHSGHVSFLEKVVKEGDYVIVGCHSDGVVNWYKGSNYPIMNIHERVLGLLSNKYVSEVFIGAPYTVTEEIMEHFRINLVVHGSTTIMPDEQGNDPFAVPKRMGKFKIIESGSNKSTTSIMEAIIRNRLDFEKRYEGKRQRDKGGAADPDFRSFIKDEA